MKLKRILSKNLVDIFEINLEKFSAQKTLILVIKLKVIHIH
jgi:hypothetical protein